MKEECLKGEVVLKELPPLSPPCKGGERGIRVKLRMSEKAK